MTTKNQSKWDLDINCATAVELKNKCQKLRDAIRYHRDAKGQDLCWINDQMLHDILPETKERDPQVPEWPDFLRGCVQYRASLETRLDDYAKLRGLYGSLSSILTMLTIELTKQHYDSLANESRAIAEAFQARFDTMLGKKRITSVSEIAREEE